MDIYPSPIGGGVRDDVAREAGSGWWGQPPSPSNTRTIEIRGIPRAIASVGGGPPGGRDHLRSDRFGPGGVNSYPDGLEAFAALLRVA
ncbi:hypothetical protein NL676_026259 [Syzygium grande]|nr:hypothetical protein NL676_026259 [Syzygium grande]